jgi:hypothetical protein
MTPIKILACVAASIIALTSMPIEAKSVGWTTIGSRTLNWQVDRETIPVRGTQRFREVRFCASRRPLRILGANADFSNGGTQDLNATAILSAGECSRAINLDGDARDITQLRMSYSKFKLFSRAPILSIQAR